MYARVGDLSVAEGTKNPLVSDKFGHLVVSGGFGKYRQSTLAGREYFAYCASQNVALFSATAAIGLIVHNPALSGVNLIWHLWSVMVWADSAAMTGMVLAVATQLTTPTTTTVATLTGRTLLTGSTGLVVGAAKAYSVATILAPVAVWPLFQNAIAVNTEGGLVSSGDLDGAFVSAPGTATVIGALGAAGVTVNLGITWEEVPI
jgi:hypothetical protein